MRKLLVAVVVLAIAACLVAATAAGVTLLSKAQVRARTQTSAQNMSALHSAFTMYEVDYGRFPVSDIPEESLFLLYRSYADDFRVFYNPNDFRAKPEGEPMPPGPEKRIRPDYLESCSYVYIPGYSSADGNAIFYYERFPTANRRNVLYVNGRVDLLDEAEFEERLKNNPKPIPIEK
jgi:type II secretory pathway pseudopilin PulG